MELQQILKDIIEGAPFKFIDDIVQYKDKINVNICDIYGNSYEKAYRLECKTDNNSESFNTLEIPKEYQSYRYKVTKALLLDEDILSIIGGDKIILYKGIELLYSSHFEAKPYEMYAIFSYITYLVKTFCCTSSIPILQSMRNNEIISNFLRLGIDEQLKESEPFMYKPEYIKKFLKISNTILILADKIQLNSEIDGELHNSCMNQLRDMSEQLENSINTEEKEEFNKDYWLKTYKYIKEQVEQESNFIKGESNLCSERMIQKKGISEAKVTGAKKQFSWVQSFV